MERVRRRCRLINGIDVDPDGSRGGFYGSPYAQDRDDSWNLLRSLQRNEELHWLVCGDFNETMYGFEKKEGYLEKKKEWKCFVTL
ncbi:reverse transcriptase [Gossypium australe]|uniref:Reverse transcriptase n=1 Tax=Gossypium australe TaxID=47621 RepID=A0A5B6W2U5_9ROSI|nr:reverse transcriptase [Gossypium australe]